MYPCDIARQLRARLAAAEQRAATAERERDEARMRADIGEEWWDDAKATIAKLRLAVAELAAALEPFAASKPRYWVDGHDHGFGYSAPDDAFERAAALVAKHQPASEDRA